MWTNRTLFSNACLGLGVLGLGGFVLFELLGLPVDPLVPALSAFFIGCTAILDRLDRGERRTE